MKKRDNYLDLLKGIGIFLVVLGHHDTYLGKYIYSFHMPLFFFISGIFHSNYKSYREFIENKLRKLVYPYFILAFSLFLFWIIIGRKFGESAIKKTPIVVSFKGIFLGNDINNISSMEWGLPLWFLLCLFIVSNLYYFISKLEIKYILFCNIILGIVGYYLSKDTYFLFRIWHFDTALIAINFYTLGNLLRNKIFDKKLEKIPVSILVLIAFLSVVGNEINGRIDMHGIYYSNILLFYLNAILGIAFIFICIKKISLKSIVLEYMGLNTIIILAYHGRMMTFIKFILIIVLKINYPEDNLILNIVFSIIQILLCIPIIFIFNRYLPFFIGKEKVRI